jgi:large subunit ribosomal protein L9
MEVILKDDVLHLGNRGDLVKVADGYARNFLLPRKLAMQATSANKAVVEQMKNAAARRFATEKALAEELAAKLEPVALEFTRKSGEAGHLFGSVTSADIAAALDAKGFEIDRRKIQLDEPRPSSSTAKSTLTSRSRFWPKPRKKPSLSKPQLPSPPPKLLPSPLPSSFYQPTLTPPLGLPGGGRVFQALAGLVLYTIARSFTVRY